MDATSTAPTLEERIKRLRKVVFPIYPVEFLGHIFFKDSSYRGESLKMVAAVIPFSSAGAYTAIGLIADPGCRGLIALL